MQKRRSRNVPGKEIFVTEDATAALLLQIAVLGPFLFSSNVTGRTSLDKKVAANASVLDCAEARAFLPCVLGKHDDVPRAGVPQQQAPGVNEGQMTRHDSPGKQIDLIQ